MDKKVINTFQEGLVTDASEMATKNTVMTYAKNCKFTTTEGNQLILQKEDGTKRVAQLTEGHIAVAVKEFNNIAYIISVKDDNSTVELGTYPSPDYSQMVYKDGADITTHPTIGAGQIIDNYTFMYSGNLAFGSWDEEGVNQVRTFNVENIGIDNDTYDFEIIGDDNNRLTLEKSSQYLPQGTGMDIGVTLDVATPVSADLTDNAIVRITSQGDPTKTADIAVSYTITNVEAPAATAWEGTWMHYGAPAGDSGTFPEFQFNITTAAASNSVPSLELENSGIWSIASSTSIPGGTTGFVTFTLTAGALVDGPNNITGFRLGAGDERGELTGGPVQITVSDVDGSWVVTS